jgi:hypothetical protein
MKSIKYFTVIVLSFCISVGLNAKTKELERNNPDTIKDDSKADYLLADGIGSTIEEAKSNAQNSLKSIVVHVAVHQMKTQNAYFKQINIDNESVRELFKKSDYYSDFDADKLYYFYYDRKKNKETKSNIYHYYLQYRLNIEEIKIEINKIALDHETSTTLESVKKQLSGYCKVQDLNNMNMKLMLLNSRFSDDDIRKVECEVLLRRIQENYKNIEIKEMLNIPGKLIVCQTINDKAIHASKPPQVKFKYAEIINIENFEEQWIINYKYNSYRNSLFDTISVEFDNTVNKVSRDFKVDGRERVEVKLSGTPINIVQNQMIQFYVASSYYGDVILERIVLRYNDLHFTDTRLNQLLKGAGLYTITYLTPPDFSQVKIGDKVSGELHYISRITGQKEVFRFYNQALAIK